ncbi:MAG: histidine kinase [Gemmatimonadaceae bacterium]
MNAFLREHRPAVTMVLVAFSIATAFGAIAVVNHFNMMIGEGSPMPWRHAMVMEMPFWYVAAILAPALLWALHRFPDRSRGITRVAQHIGIALIWIVAQAALDMGARSVLGTGLHGPQPSYMQSLRDALASGFLGRAFAYIAIVGGIYALTYYTRYRERDLAASQLEARLAETQLRMLRMQLNPHFLFNAMNTIAMLTRAGRSEESVAMLLALSTLMRDVLRADAPESCSLGDELNLLNRYVGVEQVRFGGKLAFSVDVPSTLMDTTVPSFLLQPLVENAIRHGRASSDGIANIAVRAERADSKLILSVWDDGRALSANAIASSGIGLRNVRERLAQLYGAAQSFEIGHTDAGTVARMEIPIGAL